jgi:hypothetical protein
VQAISVQDRAAGARGQPLTDMSRLMPQASLQVSRCLSPHQSCGCSRKHPTALAPARKSISHANHDPAEGNDT